MNQQGDVSISGQNCHVVLDLVRARKWDKLNMLPICKTLYPIASGYLFPPTPWETASNEDIGTCFQQLVEETICNDLKVEIRGEHHTTRNSQIYLYLKGFYIDRNKLEFTLKDAKIHSRDNFQYRIKPAAFEKVSIIWSEKLKAQAILSQNKVDRIGQAKAKDHPKGFQFLEEVAEQLNARYIAFPTPDDFLNGRIDIDEDLAQEVTAQICDAHGPCLLTAKWGAGKTVFALTLGFRLQQKQDLSVFYMDMGKHIGEDTRTFNETTILKSVSRFDQPQLVFIVDNAHFFPRISYELIRWASEKKKAVLLVSRPIHFEMSDEKEYFPELFEDRTTRQTVSDDEAFSKTAIGAANDSLIRLPPAFTMNVTAVAVSRVINWKLREKEKRYQITDSDLQELAQLSGHNLLFVALLAQEWDPDLGSVTSVNKTRIYNSLKRRFLLDEFPEVYLIAAINYFGCPADTNVIFQTDERKQAFFSTFFQPSGKAFGLMRKKQKLVYGIEAAEAKLICQVGVISKDVFLRNCDGRLPTSDIDLMQIMAIRYASLRPTNPFKFLKSLRWTAFEAKQSMDTEQEESIQEILTEALTCRQFTEFIRGIVIPNRLSMVGIGNIARLCKYVGLPRKCYLEIISIDAIEKGTAAFRQLFAETRGHEPLITWREYFAWRHLYKLDPELGTCLIKQFDYSMLRDYGVVALRRLSNLFLIAMHTDWLKQRILEDPEDMFGSSEKFITEFDKLSEVSICFFIRHTALLSDLLLRKLQLLVPAKKLAQITKDFRKPGSTLFYFVHRYMGPVYADSFEKEFTLDEIYDMAFGRDLAEITFPFSDILYRRFVNNDLEERLSASDLYSIQIFLRNLTQYSFSRDQLKWTAEKFRSTKFEKIIFNKLNCALPPPLLDIAYFLLNLGALDSPTAAIYFDHLKDINYVKAFENASLFDVGLFLLGCWIFGAFSDIKFLSNDGLREFIHRKQKVSTIKDVLTISGAIGLLKLNIRLASESTGHVDRIGFQLNRMQTALQEEKLGAWPETRVFTLALNLIGARHLGVTMAKDSISNTFDTEVALEVFRMTRDQIKKDSRTTIKDTIEQVSKVATRKIELLSEAIASLSI